MRETMVGETIALKFETARRVRGAGGGVQGYIRGGFPGGSEVHDRM
jgi:hypothetical protein